jgi:hypothetical protein
MRKHLIALGTAATIVVSGLPLSGGTASASTTAAGVSKASAVRTLTATCENRGGPHSGRIRVYYSSANGYDKITKITYDLDSKYLGDHSNVRLRIRRHINNEPDQTLWTWTSGDNVTTTPGDRYPNYSVSYATKWHVDAKFVFDNPGGFDPDCVATTKGV